MRTGGAASIRVTAVHRAARAHPTGTTAQARQPGQSRVLVFDGAADRDAWKAMDAIALQSLGARGQEPTSSRKPCPANMPHVVIAPPMAMQKQVWLDLCALHRRRKWPHRYQPQPARPPTVLPPLRRRLASYATSVVLPHVRLTDLEAGTEQNRRSHHETRKRRGGNKRALLACRSFACDGATIVAWRMGELCKGVLAYGPRSCKPSAHGFTTE